jgi:cytochrome c oxidase subunit 1
MITVTAQFIYLFNFLWSLFKGKKATSDNPWEATTLEWTISSPPPHDNFAGKIPTVYRGPYEFAVPRAKREFVMQTNSDEMAYGPAAAGD